MNFPSNILGIFSKHGGKIAPTDAQIAVAPQLLPVVDGLAQFQNLLGNGAGFPLQSQSFILDWTQQSVNGGGAVDVSIVTLAPGLWDLTFTFIWTTNDTGTFTASYIYLRDVDTLLSVFLQRFHTIGTIGYHQGERKIRVPIIPKTSWDVRVGIANTAAGKQTSLDGCLIANRLG